MVEVFLLSLNWKKHQINQKKLIKEMITTFLMKNNVNKLRHIAMLVFIFFFFIYNMLEYLREGV